MLLYSGDQGIFISLARKVLGLKVGLELWFLEFGELAFLGSLLNNVGS